MATQKPIGDLELEGRVRAEAVEIDAVITRLERRLDPFVEEVLKKHPLTFREELEGLAWFLRVGLPIYLIQRLHHKEGYRFGADESRETSGARLTTCALVRTWLEALSLSTERTGKLHLHVLDGAMLPPMNGDERALFEDACLRAGIDGDIAREILGSARRSLPAGKFVPDEVAGYFRLERVPVCDSLMNHR